MSSNRDPAPRQAVVVGGGVIGCMTAYYLAGLDWRVRLFDAGRLGGGCSHGNCGFLCPSHVLPLPIPGAVRHVLGSLNRKDSPVYLKPRFDPRLWKWLYCFAGRCREHYVLPVAAARHALLATSTTLYQELIARESIDCEWQRRGLLLVFPTVAEFERHRATVATLRERFGVAATPFAGDAVSEFEPALRTGLAGGWHYEGDSHVRPDALLAEMGRVLRERGVAIEESTPVTKIEIERGRAVGVRTAAGLQRCDAVIVATGAQTPAFAADLGCKVPIQPGKGYSLTFPRPERPPRVPIIFEESHVAVTPLETAIRVGSTMELAGYDLSLNPRRIQLLRSAAAKHLREPLVEPALEEWAGWRPLSYDDLPLIGPAPSASNAIVAAGNGMIGIATATATGKLAAQLAAGDPPHLDPTPYSLARFQRP